MMRLLILLGLLDNGRMKTTLKITCLQPLPFLMVLDEGRMMMAGAIGSHSNLQPTNNTFTPKKFIQQGVDVNLPKLSQKRNR